MRPGLWERGARVMAAIGFSLMLAAVPAARIAACDCAVVGLDEAVQEADVAFVGRLDQRILGGDNFGFPPLDQWRWSVERSRDAGVGASVSVTAPLEDGANCGVSFAVGERWLVVASVHEGTLQTSGCNQNRRLDVADPEVEAVTAAFVTVGEAPVDGWVSLPLPLLIAIGAAAGVGMVALVAFRREARS